jgi:uncharacterized protein (TIGR02246 family)
MTSKAEQILNTWMEGVNAGDADRVLAMYREDATLLPTLSGRQLKGLDDIRWYFNMLDQKQHVNVALREASLVAQTLTENVIAVSGEYDWTFGPDDTPQSIGARFTYVLECNAERPIHHHHSSRIPE